MGLKGFLIGVKNRVAVFIGKFNRDSCFMMSAALAFFTIIALVPITTLSLSILTRLKFFSDVEDKVRKFILDYFIPSQAVIIQGYVESFAKNLSSVNTISIIGFLLTGVFLLITLESNMNRIWEVKNRKGLFRAVTVYWSVLTMGPLLIGVSFYVSSIPANILSGSARIIIPILTYITSMLMNSLLMFIVYQFMPNTRVRFTAALGGAISAGLVYELLKNFFTLYIKNMAYYKIYGSIAILPIFLLWVYAIWVIILAGAEVSYFIQNPGRLKEPHAPRTNYFIDSLEVFIYVIRCYLQNKKVDRNGLNVFFCKISRNRMERILDDLQDKKLLLYHKDRGYLPYNDPGNTEAAEAISDVMGVLTPLPDDNQAREIILRLEKAVRQEFGGKAADLAPPQQGA